MLLAQDLEKEVTSNLKEIYDIKRVSKIHRGIINDTVNMIIANEMPENWALKAKEYCQNPVDRNHERVLEVNKIAEKHQLDNYLAGILYASPKEVDIKPNEQTI